MTPIISFDRSLVHFKGSFGLTDELQVINKMKRCHAEPEIYDFSLLCKNVHEVIYWFALSFASGSFAFKLIYF